MALNTPIIFHEPYGIHMLGCFYGVTIFFSTSTTFVQLSCNSQPRFRLPCWTDTGPILWLLSIHWHYNWLMKRQYVVWTISFPAYFCWEEKELYEAFPRGKCPHQRQVRLFHLRCFPLLLSPIWRTAFKSSRDSLAQYLSCLFFS